jgi:hypothetical protein
MQACLPAPHAGVVGVHLRAVLREAVSFLDRRVPGHGMSMGGTTREREMARVRRMFAANGRRYG